MSRRTGQAAANPSQPFRQLTGQVPIAGCCRVTVEWLIRTSWVDWTVVNCAVLKTAAVQQLAEK